MTKKNVCIVIPIYKESPSSSEAKSIRRCRDILCDYDTFFVIPKDFNRQNYECYGFGFSEFDRNFFLSNNSYSQLCISEEFYSRFSAYDYMLIYQPDAWVFRDELLEWCERGYDYVGAPWCHLCRNHQEHMFDTKFVGNGGLSLRKIGKFIDITCSIKDKAIHMPEDLFFKKYDMRTPKCSEAMLFSIENNARFILSEIDRIPFGFHNMEKLDNGLYVELTERPYPVVIVGKDRTMMTLEVAKSIIKHTDRKLKIIISSDRSRNGHSNFLRKELSKTGCEFVVLENKEGHYGLGGALNAGITEALKSSDTCLVIENDMIAHGFVDLRKYERVLVDSSICNLSFKHSGEGSNVEMSDYSFGGDDYVVTEKKNNGKLSYSIDIGCMIVHRRLFDRIGWFSENTSTGIVEYDFIMRFQNLTKEEKSSLRLLRAVPKNMLRDDINDKNGRFYHIGATSQHCSVKWDIPEKYAYLTDDETDSRICSENE